MLQTQKLAGRVFAVAVLSVLAASACTPQAPPSTQTSSAPPTLQANTAPTNIAELMDRLSTVQPPAQGSRAAALVSAATAPAANSSQIEQPPPTPASAPQLLDRAQYDAIDFAHILPPADAEVPLVWNGWYVDHAIDAFRQAIEKNRPLVLVVSEDWCKFCISLVYDSLRCPTVDRFAGEAVFAISSPSRDKGAYAIAGSLEIDAYPTITVLEPDARMLLERGRINGYFDSSKLGQHLETILWKTKQRDYVDENGVAHPLLPQNALGTWITPPDPAERTATAQSVASKRGLKHASPTPKCQ